jgi:hypothetical protein
MDINDAINADTAIDADIDVLKRQKKEIEQLDLQWEVERRNYELTGRFGDRAVPTRWGSVVNMVAIGIFGICWVAISLSGDTPFWFPWFGALACLIGLAVCYHRYRVASAHDAAFERYQRRREALLDEHDSEN